MALQTAFVMLADEHIAIALNWSRDISTGCVYIGPQLNCIVKHYHFMALLVLAHVMSYCNLRVCYCCCIYCPLNLQIT